MHCEKIKNRGGGGGGEVKNILNMVYYQMIYSAFHKIAFVIFIKFKKR